jgi:hypothetical protein
MCDLEFINGYVNLYKINRNGEIYSCYYSKIMTPQINESGYYFVNLIGSDKKRHKSLIHRLLAFQFLENPDNLPEIDHKDRNKTNNSLENLRWVSRATNSQNKNCEGCVYQDIRKNGKSYWKASYSYYIDEVRHCKQKTSITKEVCEEWLNNIKIQFPKNTIR